MVVLSRAQELTQLFALARAFHLKIPHNQALGIEIVDFGSGLARLRLPYRSDLAGDPESRILHPGAIYSLLDATFGLAAFMALSTPMRVATLDLRVDTLGPATPGASLHAKGECYRLTRTIAFIRGIAYHDDEAAPIAAGTATFMVSDGDGTKTPAQVAAGEPQP